MRMLVKDIITEFSVRNKEGKAYPVYSVTNSQGFCKDYFGKEVASKDKSSYKIVPYGFFAYNPSRINVGSIDWQHCEEYVIVSPLYNVFEVDTRIAKIEYLSYYFKSRLVSDFINTYAKGTVRLNIPISTLGDFPISVPTLFEQQRIVNELDLLSSIIEKKKAQLKEYDQLAQSIFYDMFGDPIDNPKGWEVKKLGEVGELQRGSGLSKKDLIDNGHPCILYGQIHTRFGAFTKKHIACIPQELVRSAKIAHCGDVIMAITSEDVEGSCKSVAWMGDYDIAIGSDAAIYRHSLNGIYVSYYTQTKAFHIEKAKYAKGFKVTHISTKEIANIPIPLPPLSLQQQFAEKIEAIERQKALIQQSISETETLFNSRMDYYFD